MSSASPTKCAGALSDAPARGLLHEPDHVTASAASPERAMYLGLTEPAPASVWPGAVDWPARETGGLGTFGQTPGHGVGHEGVAPGLILRNHAVADEERHRFASAHAEELAGALPDLAAALAWPGITF